MKVFISWSGEVSKQVAGLLREWIPSVLQHVEPWVSSEDIQKGEIWFGAIGKQLSEVNIGVICLTRDNLTGPWLLFESGALSKQLDKTRVCTLLIGIDPESVTQPLSQFQATRTTKEDMLKLVKTINASDPTKALQDERVEKGFEMWWSDFEERLERILKGAHETKVAPAPDQKTMTAEILQLSRSAHSILQELKGIRTESFAERINRTLAKRGSTISLSDAITQSNYDDLATALLLERQKNSFSTPLKSTVRTYAKIEDMPPEYQQMVARESAWGDVVKRALEFGIQILEVRKQAGNEVDRDLFVDGHYSEKNNAILLQYAKEKGFNITLGFKHIPGECNDRKTD